MTLREQQVNKPLTRVCFHYWDDSRAYVGAVWQDCEDGPWAAFCTSAKALYGHLGDFDSQGEALDCLKRRVAGDITAKGRNTD